MNSNQPRLRYVVNVANRLSGTKSVARRRPSVRGWASIIASRAGLFATERFPSGTTLARSDFASLAIEGELAVFLDREPTLEDFRHDMPSCVKQVFPVIELHHHVTRTPHPSAAELIANNAIHAGFVEGPGGDPQLSSADSSLSIHMDGRQIDAYQGPELIRTIHTSLRWLTDHLHERGERLEEDQIVLTGSITDLIPVGDNCRVVVGAPPFGVVEARFT